MKSHTTQETMQETVKDGVYTWKFINDQTGKCALTIAISKKELENIAAVMLRIETEALEAEKQNGVLYGVPQSVRSYILKILASTKKLAGEYYSYADPMISGLTKILMQEAEIINNCNLFWKALSVHDITLGGEKYKAINQGFANLKSLAQSECNVNLTSHVELLKKRVQQLAEQISNVNKANFPKAYALYMNLYKALKAEVDMCLKYQDLIVDWKNTEAGLLDDAKEKHKQINDFLNSKPENAQEEQKGNKLQPLSPIRVSPAPSNSSNESKEGSPDHSPSHSSHSSPGSSPPSRSANSSPSQVSKDSPPSYPVSAAHIKLSSLPQALCGSNSPAAQQQKQKLAAQQQSPVNSARVGYAAIPH